MFEKYNEIHGFEPILNCTNGLRINMRGFVVDGNGNTVDPHDIYDGEPRYAVAFTHGKELLGRNFLLSATCKRLTIPVHQWCLVEVLYADGNKEHFHPKNTVWKFPEELKPEGYPGYRYIPGASRYCINEEADVVTIKTGYFKKKAVMSTGYMGIVIDLDMGLGGSTTVHRCIALSWLDYPHNVDKLDVNHKDSDKLNNHLSNLEFASRRGNMLHAVENDQCCYNHRVLVRNALTKEVTEYFSIEECARQMRLDGETIRLRCNNGPTFLYPGCLQFKRVSDNRQWKHFDDPESVIKTLGFPRPVIAKHAVTDQIHLFDNSTQASKILDIDGGIIKYTLKNNSKRPCFGYWFKYRDDPTDFPLLSEEQKYFYADRTTEKNIGHLGYRITDTVTNEVQLVKQHETESSMVNLKLSTVIRYAASQKLYKDKFKIEAITF